MDNNSKKKLPSAKIARHEAAIEKYKFYEHNNKNQDTIEEMMKGEKKEIATPKPGEYIVISTDQKIDKTRIHEIPIMELLDGTRSFSELKEKYSETPQSRLNTPFMSIKSPAGARRIRLESLTSDKKDDGRNTRNDTTDDNTDAHLGIQNFDDDDFPTDEAQFKTKLTTDLKVIMKKQAPGTLSSSNLILNDIVEERVSNDPEIISRIKSPVRIKSAINFPLAQRIPSASSTRFVRPDSANFIAGRLVGKSPESNLTEEIKKIRSSSKPDTAKKIKNTYQVTAKYNARPNFITGYNTIKDKEIDYHKPVIEPPKEKPLMSPYMTGTDFKKEVRIEKKKVTGESKNGYFLPLEYYFFDEDEEGNQIDPEELVEKYREEDSQKVYGFSKWFYPDGMFKWCKCEVLRYNKEFERFEIKWLHNKTEKRVSRVNLRFEKEDEEEFNRKLENAERFRLDSEIYLKYNYMIDTMTSPTSQLTDDVKDRIMNFVLGFPFKLPPLRDPLEFAKVPPFIKYNPKFYLIPKTLDIANKPANEIFAMKKYSLNLLNQLNEEISKEFVRANHQIEFNHTLPYSEERQLLFRGILDEDLFIPMKCKASPETDRMGLLQLEYDHPGEFHTLILNMRKYLHQANHEKIKALLGLNKDLVGFEKNLLVAVKFPYNVPLPDYIQIQKDAFNDFTRDFKGRMFDSYYEVSDMVEKEIVLMKKRNEERTRMAFTEADKKLIEEKELPPDVMKSLRSYQSLLNTLFERCIRGTLERSLEKYKSQLEFVINYINKHIEKQAHLTPENVANKEFTYESIYEYQLDAQYERPYDKAPQIYTLLSTKDSRHFTLFPSPANILEKIQSHIAFMKENLTTIECLRAKEIGPARPSGYMDILLKDDRFFDEMTEQIIKYSELLLEVPKTFLKKVEAFRHYIEVNSDKLKSKLKKATFEDFKKDLLNLRDTQNEVERVFHKDILKCGIVLIDVKNIKELLLKNIKELYEIYKVMLIYKIDQENEDISTEVQSILTRLKKKPENLEELDELRQYANSLDEYIKTNMKEKIDAIRAKLNLMEDYMFKMSPEDFEKSWRSFGLPSRVAYKAEKCLKKLIGLEKNFQDDLMKQQEDLAAEIHEIDVELEIIMKEDNYEKYEQVSYMFSQIGERLDRAQREAEVVNRRQNILKWKVDDYSEIEKIRARWAPFNKVWSLAHEYHLKIPNIMNGPLSSVDKDTITNEIIEAWNDLFKLEKQTFKIVPHMYQVTQTVRHLYEEFKPYLPLINDLRNPALQARHWEMISKCAGITLDQDLNVSLKTLLDSGIMQVKDQINEISEIATKQRGLERLLKKMKTEWSTIKFELTPFRDTGTYILRQLDPILDKLDEDLTKTMSIASSPFIKFLENDVNNWKNTLIRTQDIIEIWIKVQKLWQYLQPIFFSEDIIHQMPKEGIKYQNADKIWRSIMENTVKYPLVLEACSANKIKDNFTHCLDLLEQVIKGLNDYLNTKRAAFPRFYFLSNDELLSILAQTKEPKAVQKHLSKCFEGIETLTFQNDLTITHMNSIEGETVPFKTTVTPLDKEGNPRSVEEWLGDVEKVMKSSLRDIFFKSLEDYTKKDRKKWLFDWASQIIVVADQALWTSMVEAAIEGQKEDPESLKKAFHKQNSLLLEVVDLLKLNISKKDRITLGVLIVVEVHAKDVVEEVMKAEVKSVQAFEWLAQMRYNIEKDKNLLNVSMVNTTRRYGWEYLGNQPRLVITPLTDRCYRTLMSALQMNLGGAPEGPAGTGKTETTKDLAKALAKHCVVFNCSEALDYQAMGKFFKGLCACGSWACFDEFNRIELEVLSVIAQQILSIQNALIRNSKSFLFEGTPIDLDASCAVFITMNPGYAGRSELPDNLKALFRPVAMMIPNYSMIAEISLYSYGFTDARALSIKITTCLKLSSEQLSSQSHYDFGMRAVKAIILAAGALKRAYPDEPNEAVLVLRAIKECNVPKFTTADVPLFNAILSDLFPDVKLEDKDYGYLEKGIKDTCKNAGYVLTEKFHTKIMELYETIQVRHGLMVVGATLSGKSSIMKVLAQAIERGSYLLKTDKLKQEGKTEEEIAEMKVEGNKVRVYSLNPKSVTIQLLYGAVDQASNEWNDGIVANIFRECKEDTTENYKWIVFDGPVDALWIENMNTVLDDNKKLCLMSGETIKLTDLMSIIFEVEDLLEASPATVSRCGMVFLEATHLEWTSIYKRWKSRLPPTFINSEFEKVYDDLNQQILIPLVEMYTNHKFKLEVPVYITWMVNMLFKCFEAFLFKNKTRADILQEIELEKQRKEAKIAAMKLEGKTVEHVEEEVKPIGAKEKTEIFGLYLNAIFWAFGMLIDENGRKEFDKVLRELATNACENGSQLFDVSKEGLPTTEFTIYEQHYDFEKKSWQPWARNLVDFRLPENIKFHEVFIPTVENLSTTNFLYSMLTHNFPVLFIGKTGTGKTIGIKKLLLNELDPGKFIPTVTVFSANTTCDNAQDLLESKLEKQKRRKGVYGPVMGFTNIIFIDDLNMPAKERYGAQPPLELIRQWFDYHGWYDRKSLEFKTIDDIQFVSAMGLGRAPISNRLLRNFNMVFFHEMSDETLQIIVRKTLEWGFTQHVDKVKFLIGGLTKIIFKTYKAIQSSKDFLPLPSKSHYIFNMRDMQKVVQGILSVPHNKFEASMDNRTKMLRLLINESLCVYGDRLVDLHDKSTFLELLNEKIKEEYSVEIKDIVPDVQELYFGNFMEMHGVQRGYEEIEDHEKFMSTIREYINEYNEVSRGNKIHIYLFQEAISLLIKINRVIASPFGNALLVGLGGSGRHTMSRLAAYMQDYKCEEIEMEKELTSLEWYDFLKKLLRTVGIEDKPVIFLLADSQIQQDRFFEDINNLLNIGEIPNLFTFDEKEGLLYEMKEVLEKKGQKSLTPLAIWEAFVNNCKMNLHIVLCMSPIGEKLRVRLRNFPSLVSCTSLIWILPWSESALSAVATSYLKENHSLQLEDEKKQAIANICVELHSSVNEASKRFKAELGRYYYVTPISYMQLLSNLERLIIQKQKEMLSAIAKYENGVKKLEECAIVVEQTKKELEELKPILAAKEVETEKIMQNIAVETAEADKTKEIVAKDEEETSQKAAAAAAIQAECQSRLAEALPELEAAMQALKTLKNDDFVEMKATLNKPPMPIRKTMEAVCIMLGKSAKDSDGYMDEAKKQLNEPKKFMISLEKYNKDNIADKVLDRINKFLTDNPSFNAAFAAKASKAAEGLAKWVLAMVKYSKVNKAIQPLREELKAANDKLEEANKELEKKRAMLKEIEDKCQALRDSFEKTNYEKQMLKQQKIECEVKLDRALKLTSGLGSERQRWTSEAERLRKELDTLLGDILLAVGSISYLGAFTGNFRNQLIEQYWIPKIRAENIFCSEDFDIQKTIGDPLEIQEWILQGLPLDKVSIDNAIFMKETTLWPLIIDPQKQATKYIKNKEAKLGERFVVCKPSKDMPRILENCIRSGAVLMVENIGENIDPIFDSILQKATYVRGGIQFINVGSNPVEYNKDFKLYLINNMNNPHYLPEVLTKVCLLNFTITYEGLKDQMLSLVAKEEEPKDEEEKIKIMHETADGKAKKKALEDKILELLATSQGNVLDNETLVASLTASKATSEEIETRLRYAKVTEDKINQNRAAYEPVAVRASHIYLLIVQLAGLDPVYQYSLEWFIKNYLRTIKLAEKPAGRNVKQRVKNLLDTLCKQIYKEVARSIFEKHKLLFAFMLAATILRIDEKLDNAEWMFLLTGISGSPLPDKLNPDPNQISKSLWENILELSNLPRFNALPDEIEKNLAVWLEFYNNIENAPVPAPFDNLEPFQYLLLVKVFRTDLFIIKAKDFIRQVLGEFFVTPHVFTLEDTFKESTTPLVPLIFILSPGDDPLEELKQFAYDKNKILVPLSLGKGQGDYAAKSIRESMQEGSWILLQNCHLASSWMRNLEDIVENLPQEEKAKVLNENFRLWLTTASSDTFPASLLQNSIKMTKDPPRGIKSNLQQIYSSFNSSKVEREFFNACPKQEEWRKMFMSLAFFHSVIRERKRYGPIGWNIQYDFNMSDFKISMKQLHHMLTNYDEIPYQALTYLTGECYYGGRVTDDWDRRNIMTLLKDFYNPAMLADDRYLFSSSEDFYIPDNLDLPQALQFIESLPNNETPELFGLHPNAFITSSFNESVMILNSILTISPKTVGSGGEDENKKIIQMAQDFLTQLPNPYDIEKISKKYPNNYYESMNTVLLQELARYNFLITTISQSLKRLIDAMGGFIVMSSDLENMSESMLKNQIPAIWAKRSYPSLKSLAGYFKDLLKRLSKLQEWIDYGAPTVFWLPGFYFPQSFLTGVLQNYARGKTIPIDKLRFNFEILKEGEKVSEAPKVGCYVNGLFLEGATWNSERGILVDAPYKLLYKEMPIIKFIPTEEIKDYDKMPNVYTCPVYKTSDRKGTLSTTGHSTNFILAVYMNSEQPKEYWIKRGVAMITQLNE